MPPSVPASTALDYCPPLLLRSGHWQTIYPTLLRRVPAVAYRRERLTTPDGDFLDLDWSRCGARRLLLVCHGLESSSRAKYVRGMVRAANQAGWDAAALNLRGCSGEPNALPRSYHSGATEDLATVLAQIRPRYGQVALVGFSLGGNLVLKLAAEAGPRWELCAAVGISVPCDLSAAARQLEAPANRLYHWRFVRELKAKVLAKCRRFPDRLRPTDFRRVRTLREFDEAYTAPLHGFAGAEDYYRRSSCLPLLPHLEIPALLLNAADDPFLPAACYPWQAARSNPRLTLLVPRWGGHVGFVARDTQGRYWHEQAVLDYLEAAGKADLSSAGKNEIFRPQPAESPLPLQDSFC